MSRQTRGRRGGMSPGAFLAGAESVCNTRLANHDPSKQLVLLPSFTRSLAKLNLTASESAKVVGVCAELRCGLAQRLAGRSPHAIRLGRGGGAGHVRRSFDGAKGMRVHVTNRSPGALRIHYWEIGGEIILALVCRHDTTVIPER